MKNNYYIDELKRRINSVSNENDMIKILDCTLRDGGYVNNWEFGKCNIENIISKLSSSNIEVIECGFLSNNNVLPGMNRL